jgi:peptidoglycan/LPS O-acetylase OafA/YrhL
MPVSDQRIAELDGLRGIAILMVLIWHFTGMLVDPAQGAIQNAAWRYLIFGRSGVDLFFVLSGFLIIGILIDNRESPDYFRTFYLRRALRILPPYLILVAGFWLCVEAAGGRLTYYFDRQLPLWSLLTFTQNWVMASIDSTGAAVIGGTWSLAIEEQFYLFAPMLVLLLPRAALAKTLLTIGLASIIARAGWFYFYPDDIYAPYVATPLRLDDLCVGGLVAMAYRSPAAWSALLRRRKVALGILLALIAIAPLYAWFLQSSASRATAYYFGHTYLAVLCGVSLTAILIWSGRSSTAWLRSRSLGEVGLISYSLYLFHPSFKALFFVLAHRGEQLTAPIDIALLSAALISTFVFCKLLYRYVERPAQRLGHKHRYASRHSANEQNHSRPNIAQSMAP